MSVTEAAKGLRIMRQVYRDPQVAAAHSAFVAARDEYQLVSKSLQATRLDRLSMHPQLAHSLTSEREGVVLLPVFAGAFAGGVAVSKLACSLAPAVMPSSVIHSAGWIGALAFGFAAFAVGTLATAAILGCVLPVQQVTQRWVDAALVKQLKRKQPPALQKMEEIRRARDAAVAQALVRVSAQPSGIAAVVRHEAQTVVIGSVRISRKTRD